MPQGSLIATGAVGAAIVVVVVVGSWIALRSCGNDAPPPSRAIYANAQVGEEGARAAGTAELRRLGCEHALVVDMTRLLGEAGAIRDGEPRYMVTCDVAPNLAVPSCEQVQATYFAALHGGVDGVVAVRVLQSSGRSAGPSCSRLYAPNGADLGGFPAH